MTHSAQELPLASSTWSCFRQEDALGLMALFCPGGAQAEGCAVHAEVSV